VAGIDSPGLAGSPAIALEVVRLLRTAGFAAGPNQNFNPNRAPIIVPKPQVPVRAGQPGALKITAEYDPKLLGSIDPKANIICKCEKVTEAEVVTALHRSLPIDSTQVFANKSRTNIMHVFNAFVLNICVVLVLMITS
jgi:glycerol-3-phosphate dehydrogenase